MSAPTYTPVTADDIDLAVITCLQKATPSRPATLIAALAAEKADHLNRKYPGLGFDHETATYTAALWQLTHEES